MAGTCYRIVVRGRLSERFGDSFEGLRVEPGAGTTVLRGRLLDQAELYGLLERLRDFALDLVQLEEVEG